MPRRSASTEKPSSASDALPVLMLPDPLLRKAAERVTSFDSDLRALVERMIETMYENDGIGIAAPQVGRSLQLFVANPARRRGRELVIANPIILSMKGKTTVVEGCLSVPEVWERIKRAEEVHVAGEDLKGKSIAIKAEGLLAVVLQHEYDHLQGRLFIDRLSWFRKRRAIRKALAHR